MRFCSIPRLASCCGLDVEMLRVNPFRISGYKASLRGRKMICGFDQFSERLVDARKISWLPKSKTQENATWYRFRLRFYSA